MAKRTTDEIVIAMLLNVFEVSVELAVAHCSAALVVIGKNQENVAVDSRHSSCKFRHALFFADALHSDAIMI